MGIRDGEREFCRTPKDYAATQLLFGILSLDQILIQGQAGTKHVFQSRTKLFSSVTLINKALQEEVKIILPKKIH